MNLLFQAAKEVTDFMKARHWEFCIIGGLAVHRWGEMRTTLDVDLTLLTGFGCEEDFIRPLLDHFQSRIPDALEFALRQRILLLRATNGKSLDVSLAGFPFEKDAIRRATPFEFARGLTLPTCSAEDLFVMKTFAARGKDWGDAEGIAARQKLNKRQVLMRLKNLCVLKETPEIVTQARKILEKHTCRK